VKRFVHLTILVLLLGSLFAVTAPTPSLAGGEERVLVEFAAGRGPAVRGLLERAGGQIHHELARHNVFAVSLPAQAVPGISRNPHVVAVAEDTPRYLMAQETPWGINAVQAPQVHSAGVTGSGITVCIIDSGLYVEHEDIQGAHVMGGYPNGWNTDGCGHGTHVAGTIAAQANALGVIGASPGVSLYIVKVFGNDCGWSYSSDLIDASQRCYDAGADIISMSLGGGKPRGPWEQNQFNWLYNQGVLSIAAAGNDGNTAYSYPASHSSVVSVAATDINNVVADFSQKNDQVELAAPGVAVLSTVPWIETNSLTVSGIDYEVYHIENAAYGTASGALVNGGRCTSTGSWVGKVVLCERGDVSFYDKVMAVQNGGGVAAIIYNNEPGNFMGTLGTDSSNIVALSLSQVDGQYLVGNKLGQTATIASSSSKPDSGYEAWNGTSMATPHVSAVAALLWSYNTSLTNAQIRNTMAQTALDLGAGGRDNAYGYGLVQAYAALQALGGGGDPGDTPPTVSISNPTNGSTVSGTLIVSATASDDVGVAQVAFFANGSAIGTDTNGADGWSVSWNSTAVPDGTVTLMATATDTANQTTSHSIEVTVNNAPVANQPPVAAFTVACSGLTCTFNASTSSDPDGEITAYAWNFGDGSTGTGVTASRTYAAAGTYTVVLTVTDDEGATGSASHSVTVSALSGIQLSATGYKVRGRQQADLTWSGATSATVNVYRNGVSVATTANSGAYTDIIGTVGGGSVTYKICEAGTTVCSNEVTVTF
jgi:serine protease